MLQAQDHTDGSMETAAVKISSEIMVAAVIFLFLVVVFVFFLYVYARRYWGVTLGLGGSSRARFVFVPETGSAAQRRGLDASILESLPVTVFRSADFKDGLECAVCLAEIADGEKTRLLPKCNHGFHLDCIDMWFYSHPTCPLCRSAVGAEQDQSSDLEAGEATAAAGTESQNLPTNVLFWGTPDRVNAGCGPGSEEGTSDPASRRTEGMLAIEIPRRAMEGFGSPVSPLPSSRMAVDEMKSPKSRPTSARFRSLTRLLSHGKRVAMGPSCSPRGGDIEQGFTGEASAVTPKTPKTPTNS